MNHQVLELSIRQSGLPLRLISVLSSEGINTLGDLCAKREVDLLRMPDIGRKSLTRIKEVLARWGLSLHGQVPTPTEDNIFVKAMHLLEEVVGESSNPVYLKKLDEVAALLVLWRFKA